METVNNLDGRFKGRRVFIIGGGPSLRGFDFSRLDDELTIGINNIIRYYEPSILHWLDPETYFKNHEEIDAFQGLKISAQVAKAKDTKGIIEIKTSNKPSKSFYSGGFYHSQSSALTALNIAIALGCDPIYLLGIDCGFDEEGRSHFFSDTESHPRDAKPRIYEKFAGYFTKFSEWAESDEWSRGEFPRIFNCSPLSKEKLPFPYTDLELFDDIPKQGKGRESKKVREPEVSAMERRLSSYDGETLPDCPACDKGKGVPVGGTTHVSAWDKDRAVFAVFRCRNTKCRHEFTLRKSDVKDYVKGPTRSVGFYNTSKKWNGDHVPVLMDKVKDKELPVRVIDLASGPGLLAYRVKEMGSGDALKVISIEASEQMQDVAQKVGIDVTWGDVTNEEFLLGLGRFGIVYASHILEHLSDPVSVLKTWGRLLEPGGEIFIEVPDADDIKIPGRFYEADHVNYFKGTSLKTALQRAGFKKVQILKPSSTEVSTNGSIIGGGVIRAWAEKGAKNEKSE